MICQFPLCSYAVRPFEFVRHLITHLVTEWLDTCQTFLSPIQPNQATCSHKHKKDLEGCLLQLWDGEEFWRSVCWTFENSVLRSWCAHLVSFLCGCSGKGLARILPVMHNLTHGFVIALCLWGSHFGSLAAYCLFLHLLTIASVALGNNATRNSFLFAVLLLRLGHGAPKPQMIRHRHLPEGWRHRFNCH